MVVLASPVITVGIWKKAVDFIRTGSGINRDAQLLLFLALASFLVTT